MAEAAGSSLWSTMALVVVFVAAIAALPWLLRRMQARNSGLRGGAGVHSRVLSAVAVGPQQRVVTVEVGEGAQAARLVLGVTAHNIQCLYVLAAAGQPADGAVPQHAGNLASQGAFSAAMAQARAEPSDDRHV